jgi:hypothetical protein
VIDNFAKSEYSYIMLGESVNVNDGGIIISNENELIVGSGYKLFYHS